MAKTIYSMALLCLLMVWGSNVSAQTSMTALPESGTTLKELSEVVLTFNQASTTDLGAKAADATITSDKDYNAGVTIEYGETENQMKLTFNKLTEEANYTIQVPAGAITADGQDVGAFTLNYTIGEEKQATLTPEPGEVKWLSTLIYHYPAGTTLNNVYGAKPATIEGPDGFRTVLIPEFNYQIGPDKYTLRLARIASQAGEYTVTIPDSLIKYTNTSDWSTVYLPGGTFKYNVSGGGLTQTSVTPAEAISAFDAFSVTFPDYDSISKNPDLMPNIYIMKEGQDNQVASFSMNYNITAKGNVISYKNQYSKLIDPGHYYMAFPEGCLLLGEAQEPCSPFMVEFDIVEPEPVNIVLTPADGSKVNMLNQVLIQFPDNDDVTMNSGAQVSLSRIKEDGTSISVGGAYGSSSIEMMDSKTYCAHFSGMAIEDGTYVITLNRNSFTVGTGFNQEVTATIEFTAPELAEPVLDPANQAVLDKIQHFTVSFPTETVVKLNTYLNNKTVYLYKGAELTDNGYGGIGNSQVATANNFTAVEGSTNSFTFSLSSAAIEAGDYTMVFPAGVFLMGEDEHSFNAAAEFHYTATGNGVDKIEVTPSVPVAALSEVTITYINETAIFAQNQYLGFSLYKVNPEQAWDDYQGYTSNVKIEGNQCTITLDKEYTEAGEYYIDITNWSFYLSDGITSSTPQRVTFTIDPNAATGINEVSSDQAKKVAYNLAGQRVAPNTKGLVILNNKKYINK